MVPLRTLFDVFFRNVRFHGLYAHVFERGERPDRDWLSVSVRFDESSYYGKHRSHYQTRTSEYSYEDEKYFVPATWHMCLEKCIEKIGELNQIKINWDEQTEIKYNVGKKLEKRNVTMRVYGEVYVWIRLLSAEKR